MRVPPLLGPIEAGDRALQFVEKLLHSAWKSQGGIIVAGPQLMVNANALPDVRSL